MRPRPIRVTVAGAVATAALTLTLSACTGPTSGGPEATSERTTSVAPTHDPGTGPSATGDRETVVQLTIGETVVDGRLGDSPAALDLASRLPLTLTFGDYNAVEKTSRLDPPLTMAGMPAGDDPEPGDIGFYAPSADLVLYYDDVGYWNGIARLGTFDSAGIDLLANGPGTITVTIAAADR